jgi:hypothetical protein
MTTFDVTDYGATGDGTTDDTVAIQDAINAAEAALWTNTVLFPIPSVNYKVTTQAEVPWYSYDPPFYYCFAASSNIILLGATGGAKPMIKHAAGETRVCRAILTNKNGLTTGDSNITVDNLSFDMNNRSYATPLAQYACCVEFGGYDATYGPIPRISDITIQNCYFYDAAIGPSMTTGFPILAGHIAGTNITVKNNTMDLCSNWGVEYDAMCDSFITGNTIIDSLGGPQLLYWSNNNLVDNNIVTYATAGYSIGLCVASGSSYNTFSNNTVSVNSVGLMFKTDATAVYTDTRDNVFENNSITVNGAGASWGFWINNNGGSTFTDNIVRNNTFYGMPFCARDMNDWVNKITVDGLEVYNNDFGAIPSVAEGLTPQSFGTGFLFLGSAIGSIYGDENTTDSSWNNIVIRNNTFSANGKIWILDKTSNVKISGNRIGAAPVPIITAAGITLLVDSYVTARGMQSDGIIPSYAGAGACGGTAPILTDTFTNTGNELLLLKHGNIGDGCRVHDITVTGADETIDYTLALSPDRGTFIGPFPLPLFGPYPTITYDNTNLYISVLNDTPYTP